MGALERTRLFGVARRRISAVSSISTMNVLLSLNKSSFAPTLENNLSTIPMTACSAGTNDPVCARIAIRAVWRKSVDLPAMFGPVMICRREEGVNETVLGVKTRPALMRPSSTVG